MDVARTVRVRANKLGLCQHREEIVLGITTFMRHYVVVLYPDLIDKIVNMMLSRGPRGVELIKKRTSSVSYAYRHKLVDTN